MTNDPAVDPTTLAALFAIGKVTDMPLRSSLGALARPAVATAAMAHVAVAAPNITCERFPGDLIGPLYFEKPLTSTPLRYNADRLFVPEGAGLGVTLGA